MFARKRRLNRAESLLVRVVPNSSVDVEDAGDGNLRLLVRRRTDFWGALLGAVFLVPRVRKIALDDIGSRVWRMCDGEHTVGQMAKRVAEENKLHRKEAELAVISFIDSLASRRLVYYRIEKGD